MSSEGGKSPSVRCKVVKLSISQQHSFQRYTFFLNLPARRNWPEEQIFEEQVHWVPLIMSISLEWDKVDTIRRVCIVQYRIVFSFHLVKRINRPDPGWDRKVRYCPLFGNRLLGVKLIGWEQNSRWTLTRAKTSFISGVKAGSMLVCRPCDCTSGNLNKTSVREKSRGVYLTIGWVFQSYLMIFCLCSTWEDYAWLWIVPWKCIIVWFPNGFDGQNSGMWSRGWAIVLKYSVPAIKRFRRCLAY